jgi:hypothetical protein
MYAYESLIDKDSYQIVYLNHFDNEANYML